MPRATSRTFTPDQGPLNQHLPTTLFGFQSTPVQLALLMQADWQASRVSAWFSWPFKTFVFCSSVQLGVQTETFGYNSRFVHKKKQKTQLVNTSVLHLTSLVFLFLTVLLVFLGQLPPLASYKSHNNLTFGFWSLCTAAPTFWNFFPDSLHLSGTFHSFRRHLKKPSPSSF